MKTAAQHVSRYPGARSTTLAYLIKAERIHEQLRREVEANLRAHDRLEMTWLGRLVSWWRR